MSFHKNLRGSDLHSPSQELVENNTGITLSKLKVITLDGMGSVFPQIRLSNSSLDNAFGIIKTEIPDKKTGMVTSLGFMFEIDTSQWLVGTSLYSDSSGNLTNIALGSVVATVTKQDASYGIIYVYCLVNFIKNDSIWSGFGPRDIQPIKITINNSNIAQFDVNGRFSIGPDNPESALYIKPYSGYTGSGLRTDVFSIKTDNVNLNDIYRLNIDKSTIAKVTLDVIGRQGDGLERASFTRSALFYRENDNVNIEGISWQSDFTSKSNRLFDIKYSLNSDGVDFKIKSADVLETFWTGNIKVQMIKNDL